MVDKEATTTQEWSMTTPATRDATKGAMAPQLTPEEEQEKLMEEAKNVVNAQAFYMKRCLVCGDAHGYDTAILFWTHYYRIIKN